MSARATRDEIFSWVRDILMREFQFHASELMMTAHLVDDLDLDSIDAIDLSVRLEEKTGLSFKEEELKAIQTIEDVVDFIDARLG